MSSPSVPLSDGTEIPQLGFGVFQIDPGETVATVRRALEVGYRHVDTAKAYGNEAEVGEAVRECDDHVYVTTKCWNADHGFEAAKVAFATSFERLGLDHVDLYLIHWPVPARDRYVETWKAFVELQQSDRLVSIGVSNFQPDHLDRIIDATGVTPVINQVELHPYLQQSELRRAHEERGIVTQAWSPLGQGGELLEDPVLSELAQAHGRTVGQIVLRWHLQLGNVVFPKSSNPDRIAENFDVFDFELSEDDMARIAALDRGERIGPDPDTFSVGA
jgi:2,5-diketo-D-gluconate reductase A